MVAVRDVVIPLALWASQEKEDVLFRPGESYEGGPVSERGRRGFRVTPYHALPDRVSAVQRGTCLDRDVWRELRPSSQTQRQT